MSTYSHLLLSTSRLILLFLFAKAAIISVYRWKFHPLSAYPGPWLAKLTNLYALYYTIRGCQHIHELFLHEKYGPVVRFGPNRIIFCSVSALHEIYTTREVQKSRGYEFAQPVPGVYNTFTSIDKGLHRRKRKASSPAFSDQSIKSFEPVILKNVDLFIQTLISDTEEDISGWKPPIDVTVLCRFFTLDVMGAFGFGRSFDLQSNPANRGMVYNIQGGSMVSGLCLQHPWIYKLNPFKLYKMKGAWDIARYALFARKLVEDRLQVKHDARLDMLSFILEARSKDPTPDQGFSIDELWAESRLFLVAGSDTSATTLSGAFFYLSRFPSCYEKLKTEVRNQFDTEEEIILSPRLSQCHYLRAVIDETLRMSPPIGTALWREVCADSTVIDNVYVSAGVEVACSLYAIFHSNQIFPEANTFIPERWLESDGRFPDQLVQARAAFKPFSLGSRNCMGMNLAYADITLLLAKTIWTIDFKRVDGVDDLKGAGGVGGPQGRRNPNEFQLRSYITSMHDGPVLQFRRRKFDA